MRFKVTVEDTKTGTVQEFAFERIDLHYSAAVNYPAIQVIGEYEPAKEYLPAMFMRSLNLKAIEYTELQEEVPNESPDR